jgi:predicted component of type VI protein secretion system
VEKEESKHRRPNLRLGRSYRSSARGKVRGRSIPRENSEATQLRSHTSHHHYISSADSIDHESLCIFIFVCKNYTQILRNIEVSQACKRQTLIVPSVHPRTQARHGTGQQHVVSWEQIVSASLMALPVGRRQGHERVRQLMGVAETPRKSEKVALACGHA